MSVKFIVVVSWLLPALFLGVILYFEFGTTRTPVIETNSGMRIRMCLEHVDTAKAEPQNEMARQAIGECVVAGYITRAQAGTALD